MQQRVNTTITARRVRLIGADGEQLGIVSIDKALEAATRLGLDLVEIASTADPVVCKIMNYGKFKYEKTKQDQEAKKKQKRINIKEIKFRPGTEEADIGVKLRNLIRFLERGDKVKVSLRFRGREVVHRNIAMELFQRVIQEITEFGEVEAAPKMEGRQMLMVLAPKKKVADTARRKG